MYQIEVPTCSVKDEAVAGQQRMSQAGASFLPVLDERQCVCGWLTVGDLAGESLNGLRVVDVYTRGWRPVSLDTPLHEALSTMLDNDSAKLPITDEDGRLEGILTFEAIQQVIGSNASQRTASATEDVAK